MRAAHLIDIYAPNSSPSLTEINSVYPEDFAIERKNEKGFSYLPFFGQRITCGLFGISDDYIEKYQSLDSRFIKNKASTFFFEAASNSMEPLIFEKDVLIVDRSIESTNNKVVVVSLNGEMICKRLVKKGNLTLLRSENPAYKDIRVTEEMDAIVFGVVVGIARELI